MGEFHYRSPFLRILEERGFLYQLTHPEELDALFAKERVTVYWGCDATAASLHVGNLMGLMVMRWLQETGHRPLLLVGDGTTLIGDPSGRTTERPLLSPASIQANAAGIRACFEKILSFQDDQALCVNNQMWLEKIAFIPFLRDIGFHFSIHRMIHFDSIKTRLDQERPLSFTEFSYLLLQAYDFLQLYQQYGCKVQVGGADQWGNIVSGMELVRKKEGGTVYGLTWPLLQTSSGVKMGKTAQGAIWLNENLCSPYAYWQFWRSTDDADVIRFLKLYTMVSVEEIEERFGHLQGKDLTPAKIFLADHATALLHGDELLSTIHQASAKVFYGSTSGDVALMQTMGLPTYSMEQKEILMLDVLCGLGFVSSRREGRQKIRQNAVKLNDQLVKDELLKITKQDFKTQEILKISLGTKKHGLVMRKENRPDVPLE